MKLRFALLIPAFLLGTAAFTASFFVDWFDDYDYEGNHDNGQFVVTDRHGNTYVCGTAGRLVI